VLPAPVNGMRVPLREELDGRLWILEFITAGGTRIALIAARRIAESKERIGKDMSAIQRA